MWIIERLKRAPEVCAIDPKRCHYVWALSFNVALHYVGRGQLLVNLPQARCHHHRRI